MKIRSFFWTFSILGLLIGFQNCGKSNDGYGSETVNTDVGILGKAGEASSFQNLKTEEIEVTQEMIDLAIELLQEKLDARVKSKQDDLKKSKNSEMKSKLLNYIEELQNAISFLEEAAPEDVQGEMKKMVVKITYYHFAEVTQEMIDKTIESYENGIENIKQKLKEVENGDHERLNKKWFKRHFHKKIKQLEKVISRLAKANPDDLSLDLRKIVLHTNAPKENLDEEAKKPKKKNKKNKSK